MSQLFDDSDLVVEAPVFREPRRKGAAAGSARDARFLNDYPPDWKTCTGCGGKGRRLRNRADRIDLWTAWLTRHPGHEINGQTIAHPGSPGGEMFCGLKCLDDAPMEVCPDCLGMGSLRARVRLEAGHRCVRCKHPWMPKGDAKMLNAMQGARAFAPAGPGEMEFPPRIKRSGVHSCPDCKGSGLVVPEGARVFSTDTLCPPKKCPTCKGSGEVWEHWSPCTPECSHQGTVRLVGATEPMIDAALYANDDSAGALVAFGNPIEAAWRILTVHHLDGDKSCCSWGNLAALCQACHLTIQGRVVMERVYPHPHSEWFRPYAAWHYAKVYLGEDLSRAEVDMRMDELLALELDPSYS